MDDLSKFLAKVCSILDIGFDAQAVREIIMVTERMRHDQTKKFRFKVEHAGKAEDLYLEIFLDDVESPDISFRSSQQLIKALGEKLT